MKERLESKIENKEYFKKKNEKSLKQANIALNCVIGLTTASMAYVLTHEFLDVPMNDYAIGSLSDSGLGQYIKDISLTKPFLDSLAKGFFSPIIIAPVSLFKIGLYSIKKNTQK